MIKIKVPTWFASDMKLPKQFLLRKWRQVSTTGHCDNACHYVTKKGYHRNYRKGGKGWRVGESHHRAKLTDHDVELIRVLREHGMKLAEIARKFECSPGNIWMIVNYRSRIQLGTAENKVFE